MPQETDGMFARRLARYSVLTVALGRLLVVIARAPEALTTSVNVVLTVSPLYSAVISMVLVPAVLGVPEIMPLVEESCRPSGSVPLLTLQRTP